VLSDITESVTIYKNYGSDIYEPEIIETFSSSSTIKLHDGEYTAIPDGDKASHNPINFVIDREDKEIHIEPDFSEQYLESILDNELEEINYSVSQYNDEMDGYTLSKGTIYGKGEWFGAVLSKTNIEDWDGVDMYRTILHKVEDKWLVVVSPRISIRYADFPDIPKDIVNRINHL
jgi:hypothetical protein